MGCIDIKSFIEEDAKRSAKVREEMARRKGYKSFFDFLLVQRAKELLLDENHTR